MRSLCILNFCILSAIIFPLASPMFPMPSGFCQYDFGQQDFSFPLSADNLLGDRLKRQTGLDALSALNGDMMQNNGMNDMAGMTNSMDWANFGQEPKGELASSLSVISGLNVNGLGWFSGRAKVDRLQEVLQNLAGGGMLNNGGGGF